MVKKRPQINLNQPFSPRTGDMEKLFATEGDVEQSSGLQILALRLDAIQPDPDQPRSTFPREGLEELSSSIRQDGIIQPIEVTEIRPNVFMIVHGERRWRAAKMAGLETIPAVVRRRDYDQLTRFVRQIVENIQREDLNDVDRAAGMIHLRDLLQEELNASPAEEDISDKPWAKKVTWAKVGERLGYSRQRIHQLIKLLDLPDEIKDAVRDGALSERDTRIYQGLRPSQQRALHKARMAGDIDAKEMREVARLLKEHPELTAHKAIRLMRDPESRIEPVFHPEPNPSIATETVETPLTWDDDRFPQARRGSPSNAERLTWILGQLKRIQRGGMNTPQRQEALQLLELIQLDVLLLIEALQEPD